MGPLPTGFLALLINGEPGNNVSIYEHVYPYAHSLYLYTLQGRETPAAEKFIRYALSRNGQRIIQNAGFVPLLPPPPPTNQPVAR